MHVQVERQYFARRYRKGLVTIEPQMHVDAQYHQLTYNKSMGSLHFADRRLHRFQILFCAELAENIVVRDAEVVGRGHVGLLATAGGGHKINQAGVHDAAQFFAKRSPR